MECFFFNSSPFRAPQENHYYTHTLALKDDFKAACFTKSTNEILVGTNFGKIYVSIHVFHFKTV